MRIGTMAAMTVVLAGAASARNIEVVQGTAVPVCLEQPVSSVNVYMARSLASKMFTAVGVSIQWLGADRCPDDAIKITLKNDAPPTNHPGAYAYALPFEGKHIVLFWDRIVNNADSRQIPFLLAHVVVHEITHILQGTCRHSETGVMKAVFKKTDLAGMELRALPFAPEDVILIQAGLEARAAILARSAERGPSRAL